jgi:hypothetical protein
MVVRAFCFVEGKPHGNLEMQWPKTIANGTEGNGRDPKYTPAFAAPGRTGGGKTVNLLQPPSLGTRDQLAANEPSPALATQLADEVENLLKKLNGLELKAIALRKM